MHFFAGEKNDFFEEDFDVLDITDFAFLRRVYPRSNHFEGMDNLTFFQRLNLKFISVLSLQSKYILYKKNKAFKYK